MEKFIKKWNGKAVEDWGTVASKEFKSFCTQFFNAVKRELPDAELVNTSKGHYYLSGFLRKGEKYVYFSYSVPRGGFSMDMTKKNAMEGILIRRAKDEKDYRGQQNFFTNFYDFKKDVEWLFAE